MSNATDKTDIKAWLEKASRAIYAATEAEAAEDISEGLSMALLRIAELEAKLRQSGQDLASVVNDKTRLEAERDRLKATLTKIVNDEEGDYDLLIHYARNVLQNKENP